jgi:dienelactone hydrolase
MAALLLGLGALAPFAPAAGAAPPEAEAAQEVARTWRAALVFLPDRILARPPRVDQLAASDLPAGRYPTVIYLHGCAGIDSAALQSAAFLAAAGYAVLMPDGFARREKRRSCEPARHRGGLHRGVLAWRQAEAMTALSEARGLPFVAPDALFLMGFSEGAVAAATLPATGARARVIEGWTCHAGWPEYQGLKAPAEEPVLALVAVEDPWFRLPVLQGECGAFMHQGNGSVSLVYRPPHPLAAWHALSWHVEARGRILAFLAAHRPPPGDPP